VYAAFAADTLRDVTTLRALAHDRDDNVKEAAIAGLSRREGHNGDDEYIAALSAKGYQAIRAGARALKGSPKGAALLAPLLSAANRIARDSSETSRDARLALVERLSELASSSVIVPATLSADFDCAVAQAGATAAAKSAGPNVRIGVRCNPLPITLPTDAVALALGRDVRLRVTLADSSGGGSFMVRLRGDVAPIMAARVLALARSGYYNGRMWHRVEHDFVIQGGGGGSEYIGYPHFMRDELGTVPHARGTVGMSTRGHDTGDGQWFVNLRDNFRLNGDYTVFGEVIDGIDVVDGVLQGDVISRIDVVGR
jgi:cyclophilin family peptidyl-prolyl cis-trans isomerase